MGSNDSSILAALQKQWEKQKRLDKERFNMERQKEERRRMGAKERRMKMIREMRKPTMHPYQQGF